MEEAGGCSGLAVGKSVTLVYLGAANSAPTKIQTVPTAPAPRSLQLRARLAASARSGRRSGSRWCWFRKWPPIQSQQVPFLTLCLICVWYDLLFSLLLSRAPRPPHPLPSIKVVAGEVPESVRRPEMSQNDGCWALVTSRSNLELRELIVWWSSTFPAWIYSPTPT